MTLAERFRTALASRSASRGPELLPMALSEACRDVLPVDDAGISVMGGSERRLPLGASGSDAATAERWQFTVGEGPCFSSFADGRLVVADEESLQRRWPVLHDQLRLHTPFHCVVALPLGRGGARLGAVDLYFRRTWPGPDFDPAAAQEVVALVYWELLDASGGAHGDGAAPGVELGGPAWLDAPPARRRRRVWVAMGMSNLVLGVDNADALALLRARAYAGDIALEELADDIVEGRLPVEDLQEHAGS